MRKEWRRQKKERENAKKAAEAAALQQQQQQQQQFNMLPYSFHPTTLTTTATPLDNFY